VFSLGFESLATFDSDGDGMPDWWEILHELDPNDPSDAFLDPDGDGLTNLEEHGSGTNPNNIDSDGDGLPDAWEIANDLDPSNPADAYADPDGDGITNKQEKELGTDPNSHDPIGLRNLGFGDTIEDDPEVSFRPANPSDLYLQESIPHWQSNTGDYIEIWNEGNGNPYVELQADRHAQGIKQTFQMLPGTQITFLLAYKGRYHLGQPAVNAFDLKLEGALTAKVDDIAFFNQYSFMESDTGNQWADWNYSRVTIDAPLAADQLHPVTLSFVPKTVSAPGSRITRGAFVDMVSVAVEDNVIPTGVDRISRTVSVYAAGFQRDFWIMAPLQGPESFTYENLTRFRINMGGNGVGILSCENATPDSDMGPGVSTQLPLNDDLKDVLWKGIGTGVDSEKFVTMKINGSQTETALPVKVKAMKYRQVKLKVYKSVRKKAEGTLVQMDQNLVPSEKELEDYLNPLFGHQLNAWFDVEFADDTKEVEWGDEFTYTGSSTEHSTDQDDVITAHSGLDANYDMHLFLLGHDNVLEREDGKRTAKGIAISDLNTCWVLARPVAGSGLNTKPEVLETIGHEIGHIFFGDGHPDAMDLLDRGVAPLVGTDHTKRLMYGGKLNANSRLIVKKEWDEAEIWLKDNPDRREQEQQNGQ
jgi:hypothetical protein